MAVANPCLQKNWGDWKSEMEDNRRERWREGVSCWADVEVSDGGEEKRECEEVEEDVVSEEKEVSNEERENEREKEAEEWEETQDEKEVEEDNKETKQWYDDDNRKQFEANEKVDTKEKESKEYEVDGKEIKMDEDKEEGENEIQWTLMGSEEVVEQEDDVKTKGEEKENENGVDMVNINGEVEEKKVVEGVMDEEKSEVGREVTDEKEENKQYIDEEAKEEDNGEERQEEDQTGDSDLGEQFGERLARTEVDNIHQNQENKSQDDETQNDLDSVESMDNKDSDSTGCEDTCHSLERFKDEEQDLQTQHHENLQDHAELSLSNDNHISGARSSKRSNEGEDSETLTDAESQTNDEKESQEEEESNESDDEEEYSTDEDNNDEDAKIYSINHYHADIFHTLTQFKDSSLLTDLTLCTKGGKSFHVHSPVLAAVSSFIWAHLSRDTGKKDDDKNVGVQSWSVYLGPEVDHVGLGAIVEFAYTGLISCLNKDTVEQVKTAAQTLGVPRVLRLCTEADGASTKTGEQNKDGKILADEQMMVSLQSIKQLWMDRIGCDVTLEALGESLHVHRVILAATSDYFRGMFTLGMMESNQACVTLPFLLAPELQALISCSYSGTLPLSWKCVFEITSTALQLQYKPALTLCFNFLQQEINPHSCLDVASFAEAYEMEQLLEVAEDFVLQHFQKVACTSKFKDLPAEQLLRYLKSHSLCVPSELVVFKAVVAWIQAKPKKRFKFAKELMTTIYFPLMTFKEFKEVQSLDMWSDHTELYEAISKDFCSNDLVPMSMCRIYMPKESVVLIGGDQISEDLGRRSISRDVWFGNSLRNHTGIKKAMEWRKLGEMPEPARFSHEVAVLKGQLYVFGGKKYYGTGDTLSSVCRFNPLQNCWENLAEMQEKRCCFSVVVLDEKIYAIGGFCDPEYRDSVEQYCPTTHSWSFTSSLDLPLSGHVAKVLQGKIYMSGGRNSDYQSLATTLLYHPETGSTYLSNMTTARAHHCMEALGDCLYAAGGLTADDNMTIVDQLACEMYNPAADSWTVFASLPVPHVGAGSTVLEGRFYVLGGYSQEDYSDTKMVHRYDPTTQKWENMGKMPGPNNDIRASVLSLPAHFRL